ncbi:MAG: metallophosphoesterase [Myxococcales bacterium]|nr:metallophosphoesterase [Myxococcales bacterium]
MSPEQIVSERARYERVAMVSIARWIDEPLPKIVCFSDTHFVPRETGWSDDAPEDLVALLRTLGDHEPLSLGDLTESVGLRASERRELFRSARLADLWALLAERRARIVIGNHDVSARDAIFERFGRDRVLDGGCSLGGVSVRHGHERAPLATELVRIVGPWVVPAYERGRKLARRGAERLSNDRVLAVARAGASFVLFGHTHSKGVDVRDPTRAWANPGCFLRSAQSFIVLEGEALALYRRAS